MLTSLKLERKQNNSSNAFRIRIFLFRAYSFGIETITSIVRSCSSLENHTRFQTKTSKVYQTRFQSKKAQKILPFGAADTYMADIREHPPPPGSRCRFLWGVYLDEKSRKITTERHEPTVSTLEISALKIESKKMTEEQQAPTPAGF